MTIVGLLITYLLLSSGLFWFVTAVLALLVGIMVSHTVRIVVALAISFGLLFLYRVI